MMSYGYTPEWSEGAIKCPIYQTSTFVFKTAEEGKSFFEIAYGIRERQEGEKIPGLIYSRLNNPDIEILENRIALWDNADDCASFESGMSAISTVMLEYLTPGDFILASSPSYGGTDHFIKHFLTKMHIHHIEYFPWDSQEDILNRIDEAGARDKVKLIYTESPANPTNDLFDIAMLVDLGKKLSHGEHVVKVAVDNTYMGPLWQRPLEMGADFSIYSATKYIGGHSDTLGGVLTGSKQMMEKIFKSEYLAVGSGIQPMNAWLLLRGLRTLPARLDRIDHSTKKVLAFLKKQDLVESIIFPHDPSFPQYELAKKQMKKAFGLISFYIKAQKLEEIEQFCNGMKTFRMAVSWGGHESLIIPKCAGMERNAFNPQDPVHRLIRLYIGLEDADFLIQDLAEGFNGIGSL